MVSGDYKIIVNIEDDEVTCNSHTVFSQLGRNAEHHNFFYVDRHGNWVVGRSSRVLPTTRYDDHLDIARLRHRQGEGFPAQ